MGVLTSKYYKLELLLKWEHITEVNQMLLNGDSPHKVSDWCKAKGFSISHPKLYEYKTLLQQAIVRRVTIEQILGIDVPKRKAVILQELVNDECKMLVTNEIDVLEAIIQRGFNALSRDPVVKMQDAMRAIELKHKLTGGSHGGLTTYGLDKLKELEELKFNALIGVVMKYLPEDKLPELQRQIADAERKFYEINAPELLPEYEKTLEDSGSEEDKG